MAAPAAPAAEAGGTVTTLPGAAAPAAAPAPKPGPALQPEVQIDYTAIEYLDQPLNSTFSQLLLRWVHMPASWIGCLHGCSLQGPPHMLLFVLCHAGLARWALPVLCPSPSSACSTSLPALLREPPLPLQATPPVSSRCSVNGPT